MRLPTTGIPAVHGSRKAKAKPKPKPKPKPSLRLVVTAASACSIVRSRAPSRPMLHSSRASGQGSGAWVRGALPGFCVADGGDHPRRSPYAGIKPLCRPLSCQDDAVRPVLKCGNLVTDHHRHSARPQMIMHEGDLHVRMEVGRRRTCSRFYLLNAPEGTRNESMTLHSSERWRNGLENRRPAAAHAFERSLCHG
jgi:hypothetical protein